MASPSESHHSRISIVVDVANIPSDSIEHLLKEAAALGHVTIAKAFADFRRTDLADVAIHLFRLGFELRHCPSWPNGGDRLKSVVDSILAQDLRDQAEERPDIDTFILASGDRDFMAVTHALRRRGRRVFVASTPDASSRELVLAADGLISLPMPQRVYRPLPASQPAPAVESPRSYRPLPAARPPEPAPEPPRAHRPLPAPPPPLPLPAPAVEQPVNDGLLERIRTLLTDKPYLTARQVLHTLAPRSEANHERRRQAIGEAIAALVQQGRLVKSRQLIGGHEVEVLMVVELAELAQPEPAQPEEVPAAETVVAAPVAAAEPRSRSGRRRSNPRRAIRESTVVAEPAAMASPPASEPSVTAEPALMQPSPVSTVIAEPAIERAPAEPIGVAEPLFASPAAEPAPGPTLVESAEDVEQAALAAPLEPIATMPEERVETAPAVAVAEPEPRPRAARNRGGRRRSPARRSAADSVESQEVAEVPSS